MLLLLRRAPMPRLALAFPKNKEDKPLACKLDASFPNHSLSLSLCSMWYMHAPSMSEAVLTRLTRSLCPSTTVVASPRVTGGATRALIHKKRKRSMPALIQPRSHAGCEMPDRAESWTSRKIAHGAGMRRVATSARAADASEWWKSAEVKSRPSAVESKKRWPTSRKQRRHDRLGSAMGCRNTPLVAKASNAECNSLQPVPCGSIPSTSPDAKAAGASTVAPVRVIRSASAMPTQARSNMVPPAPGRMPSLTSGSPITVPGACTASRCVHAIASSKPPPRHGPLMSATVGHGSLGNSSNTSLS
mmetsp:Transcript_15104/g.48164  ORF Transcript_15104/g.48164 Transcript_15104/m.48164 type:complete len:303 (+) Transcript_15104:1925-2833(+)